MANAILLDRLAAGGLPVEAQGQSVSVRGRVFSEDPREDRVDEVEIEVWQGNGASAAEAVVRYRRERSGGAVALEGVEAGLRLTSAEVERLIELVLDAEAVVEQPVELTWTLAAGQFAITDAGPIETPLPWGIERGQPRENDGWTRTNAGEIFPLPMTPMTWSLMGVPLDTAFGHMYHKPQWTEGRHFVALAGGYVYFNFGLLNSFAVDRLGMPGREMLMGIGGPGAEEGFDSYGSGMRWGTVLRNLPYALRRTREHRTLPQRWIEIDAQTVTRRERLRGMDLASLEDDAILAELQTTGEWLQALSNFLMDAQSAAFGTFALVSYLLRVWLGHDDDVTSVIQGLPGIRTAEGNVELWKLAQRAGEDAATRELIASTAAESLLETLRKGEQTRWLAEAIDAFLAEYGHRSAGELELMEPRWSDDPALLLRPFREYVLNPRQESAAELAERQVAAREAGERKIAEALGSRWFDRALPLRRRVMADYIKWAQIYAPLRENPKFSLLSLVQEQRRLLCELADRLIRRGRFDARDEVFFLFRGELEEMVRHPADEVLAGRMRSRVVRRRRQYEIWKGQSPPAVLGARAVVPTERAAPAAAMNMATTKTGMILAGMGAAPGEVEGVAHVALTAEEGNRLSPGQILVARFTDPGWTPIFPLAAGVVTDIGGRLSHGAIVAREYGIPAVVNVREATSTIVSGQQIRVDGIKGTVEILSDPA